MLNIPKLYITGLKSKVKRFSFIDFVFLRYLYHPSLEMRLYLFRTKLVNGVNDLRGSEHFDYMKLNVLWNIEKVLEEHNKLISDNLLGNNVKAFDYKF